MKLIQYVQEYGTRSCIRLNYHQETLFFTGAEPTKYTLITLDLPEVNSSNYAEVAQWLSSQGYFKGQGKRDVIYEFPPHLWRPTVLNDFIDAAEESVRGTFWQISQQFSLTEVNTFLAEWLPVLEARLQEIDQKTTPQERINTYKKYQTFCTNLLMVIYQVNGVLTKGQQDTLKRLEQEQLTLLRQKPINPAEWVNTAASFQTHELIINLVLELVRHLLTPPVDTAQLFDSLDQMRRRLNIRQATYNNPSFWNLLKPYLHLPPTLSGETIDLSQAQEVVAPLNWDLWEADRIGQCTPGRRALLITTRPNQPNIYIAAERKFKFQVAAAGGQLTRHNNSFVMGQSNPLNKALLEVELLDSLAQVNPQKALQRIAHLNLPTNHPVFAAAEAAGTDFRQARLLGDLLIELVLGVDADVARNLVRAHAESARGNNISLWI